MSNCLRLGMTRYRPLRVMGGGEPRYSRRGDLTLFIESNRLGLVRRPASASMSVPAHRHRVPRPRKPSERRSTRYRRPRTISRSAAWAAWFHLPGGDRYDGSVAAPLAARAARPSRPSMDRPDFLEPGRIGPVALKNRLVRAPTSESMAEPDGRVNDALKEFYGELARGGAGLIVTGHLFVEARGQYSPRQMGIHDDALVPGLSELVDRVHAAGGTIFAELAHAGSQSVMPDVRPGGAVGDRQPDVRARAGRAGRGGDRADRRRLRRGRAARSRGRLRRHSHPRGQRLPPQRVHLAQRQSPRRRVGRRPGAPRPAVRGGLPARARRGRPGHGGHRPRRHRGQRRRRARPPGRRRARRAAAPARPRCGRDDPRGDELLPAERPALCRRGCRARMGRRALSAPVRAGRGGGLLPPLRSRGQGSGPRSR